MNITEKEFARMKPIERELVLFKNTEEILRKQKKIDLQQKIQYVIFGALTIAVVWLIQIHIVS